MTKAKDMSPEQIAHTFCTWCDYRLMVASCTYWGCGLAEEKKDQLCAYKKTMLKEEE
jgi:phage-related protein